MPENAIGRVLLAVQPFFRGSRQRAAKRLVVGAIGLLGILALVGGKGCLSGTAKRRTEVIVTPTYVRYVEDGRMLDFEVELLADRTLIVFLPGEERWRRTMPDWARDRRDEIVAEMKRLTKGRKLEWRVVE